MDESKIPVGVMITWLRNVEGKNVIKIKGNGQVIDSIRTLHSLGGTARVEEVRHSYGHMREIQKCFILGLVKKVKKDCDICPGRKGSKVNCFGTRQRCAARYLLQLTDVGYKAVQTLREVDSKDCKFYPIEVDINPFWWNYFQTRIW